MAAKRRTATKPFSVYIVEAQCLKASFKGDFLFKTAPRKSETAFNEHPSSAQNNYQNHRETHSKILETHVCGC